MQRLFGDALASLPPAPQHFVLYFRFESEELTDESRRLVQDVLQAVKQRPDPDVVGHRPHRHDRHAGQATSSSGCAAPTRCAALLVDAGLAAASIAVTSHGEAELLVRTADGVVRAPQPPRRNHGPMTLDPAAARPAVRARADARRGAAVAGAAGRLHRTSNTASTTGWCARSTRDPPERPRGDRGRGRAEPGRRSGNGRGAATPWRTLLVDAFASSARRRSAWTSSSPNPIAAATRTASPMPRWRATLREGRVVLGYAHALRRRRQPAGPCAPPPLGLVDRAAGGRRTTTRSSAPPAPSAACRELTEAAGAPGVSQRRAGFRRHPAARAAAGAARRRRLSQPGAGHGRGDDRHAGRRAARARTRNATHARRSTATSVPLDGKSNLLVRYRGKKHTFRYVSAADVMHGPRARRRVRGQAGDGRHDGARHARGGGDAARHAVRRRRGAGDGGRQPAAARLLRPARARRRHRNASGAGAGRRSATLLVAPRRRGAGAAASPWRAVAALWAGCAMLLLVVPAPSCRRSTRRSGVGARWPR